MIDSFYFAMFFVKFLEGPDKLCRPVDRGVTSENAYVSFWWEMTNNFLPPQVAAQHDFMEDTVNAFLDPYTWKQQLSKQFRL